MEHGRALAGELQLHVCADQGKAGRVVSGRGLPRGLFAVLELVRLYSAPRILGVEFLPAGNVPLSGTDNSQGQGVSIP
ncbi:MAG: hypothetical protein LBJ82_05625 [Deltaproteobacteria bacterium]|jgi:hypothetical protein|nr:hypothetical protein [Deltaproteobacteria bacterium]